MAVCRLSVPSFSDGRDHTAQYENAADGLVLGRVPDDHRQARALRLASAAPACSATLRDGVYDAAQVPAGHDQSETRTTARRCLWQTGPLAISSNGCSGLITVSAVISSRFTWMNSYFVTIGGRRRWQRSKRCSDLELGINPLNMRRYEVHPTWASPLSRADYQRLRFAETTG